MSAYALQGGIDVGLSAFAKAIAGGIIGFQAVMYAMREPQTFIRPPGAKDDTDFLARCVRCGKCLEACPYESIRMVKDSLDPSSGTPCISVREKACRMCEDLPCVKACPTGALRDCEEREDIRMGIAVINEKTCLSYKGMRCEVCYRACPLLDRAIAIDYRMREGDDRHSVFAPVIDPEVCTGCGWCVERCVTDEPAIAIVRDKADAEGYWDAYNIEHGYTSDEDPAAWSAASGTEAAAKAFSE